LGNPDIAINLDGIYIKTQDRKVSILSGNTTYSAEEYVQQYLNGLGFNVLETESVPFHVIFGVFMWLLIQDPADRLNRLASFGDRNAFEKNITGKLISTFLPEDFGSSGYYERRKESINTHLETIPEDRDELLWTFDYWLDHSNDFRQYLWAHRQSDIEKAKRLLSVLPPGIIKRILNYLIQDYYHRYLGWPDMLVFRDEQFFFAEVKSSNDELREDQKDWIRNNALYLKLPFRVYKIHKKSQYNSLEDAQSANP